MIGMVWDLMFQTEAETCYSIAQFPVLFGTGWDPKENTWLTLEIDYILSAKDTLDDLQAVVLDREYLEGQATYLHSARGL
jgi:hypothetical protein